MDRASYTPEDKAAVMAALLAGQSVSEVAKTYNIPRGTVASWSARTDRTVATDANTKKEIGDLLLEYLKENLRTLRAQLKVFGDEKWLRQQSASEIAVLHGVMADKGIRLLEALTDSDEEQSGGADV